MKITQKQLFLLVHLLQDSLSKNVVGYLSTSQETRSRLLNDIINQQDNNKLLEIKEA